MARVREFSADIALNKAIEMFWERGYANTSMREMVKHTGVAHAGLYTAFGGKDGLFQSALEKYEERIFKYLFAGIESERADLRDIKKLFQFMQSAQDDKYFKHGCFIANTALEFGEISGPIHDILSRTFNRQVQGFLNALKNAKEKSQIKSDVDIEDAASCLTVLFYGCSSLTRMNAPNDSIQRAINSQFNSLVAN